jgi:branched-subunit amino acid aminotransferase/4-amino-4-deoxychorismate lyase
MAYSKQFAALMVFPNSLSSTWNEPVGRDGNLAYLINGRWLTPSLDAGVLPGIIREIALKERLIEEAPLTLDDLSAAEAAVALSSMKLIQPIEKIDDRVFTGAIGRLTL